LGGQAEFDALGQIGIGEEMGARLQQTMKSKQQDVFGRGLSGHEPQH